jgi:hypothetical protein
MVGFFSTLKEQSIMVLWNKVGSSLSQILNELGKPKKTISGFLKRY